MKNYKSLIENIVLAVFMLLSLKFFIFPGLENKNMVVNMVSLISFCLLVIITMVSVSIKDED